MCGTGSGLAPPGPDPDISEGHHCQGHPWKPRYAPGVAFDADGDPVAALDRLLGATERGEVDALGERHGIELLGVFGSAVRRLHDPDAPPPRDLDLAVRLGAESDLLALIADLVDLAGYDGVDVAVLNGAESVLRSEALSGIGLYERETGAWATAQMAALAERRDTAHLRRLDLEALAG
jgi:predicted nucleotidyltransferase